ncbi:Ig-like domain-containing protein [Sinomicrobium sp. M5D2P17]
MKKFLLRSFLLLGLSGLPQLSAQSITFTGCENQDFISGYTLSASGNITDAGIDRTVYKSNPAQGSFGELIIIKWNATADRWEILFNSFDGDDGPNNELLYTSTVATHPNPPNIAIGNWTNADEYGCDPLDATHGELSGDVADTPPTTVNTAPVVTAPSAPGVTEDNTNIALADNIQVADADGDDQTVTFTITGGTLSIGTAGITFGGSGNGSSGFTASGTLANINTALDAATFTPSPNLYGSNAASIAFVSNDGVENSNTASVSFDITGINDDPTFDGLPASVTVMEDAEIAYLSNALSDATFADVDAGDNDVTLVLSVNEGTLNFANPGGVITITGFGTPTAYLTGTVANIETYLSTNTNAAYFPPLNLSGPGAATLTLSANDGGNTGEGGGTMVELGQIQIDITPVNDPPVAVEDEVTTDENTPVTGNVLTNDTDIEGDALTASLVTAPVNGTVVLNADGSFIYTPNTNYNGPDSLQYQVCDHGTPSLCDTTSVQFTIEAINNAPVIAAPASINVDEDAATALTGISFSDADADIANVMVTLSVPGGTLSATSGGGVTVGGSGNTLALTGSITDINAFIAAGGVGFTTAANETNDIVLTVAINDNGNTGSGGSQQDTAAVTLSVTAVNDAPVAVEDEIITDVNTPVTSNVLTNDSDPEGDALTASLVTAPVNGTVVLNADGSLTYTPTTNYSGLDSLQYQVCDNGTPSLCDTTAVKFTINDNIPPVIESVHVPANGYYNTGDALTFMLDFNENVTVGGVPSLDLTVGNTTRQAQYISGTGSTTLLFRYTVQEGDNDTDGIALNNLSLNGGTITDTSGNDAVLALNNVPDLTNVRVNTTMPTVTISTATPSPVNMAFTATITFSEAVTGFVSGDITVTNATISNLQTSDNITYTVTVTPGADGEVTLQVPAGAAQNIGENGNSASNTLSIVYDGTAPVVSSVNVPANGYYQNGDIMDFTVQFHENVNVGTGGGTPYLGLTVGTASREAGYISGDGTNVLLFRYVVQPDDEDLDGISLASALILNGSVIDDTAGNNASLALNNTPPTGNILVYSAAPSVTLSGTPGANTAFTMTVAFSEAVTGFTTGDINATNAMLSNLQTSDNIVYTVLVTPNADGPVSLQVPADVATNIAGNGNTVSNILSYDYDATVPGVPEGLEAVPGDGEVILNWTANTESDLAGYKIYGGTTANPGTLLETADAPLTTYTHSGLTNGTLYYYRISAVDEAGNESGETADVNARPKGNQTISFDALTDRTYGDASFGLTATTSSGLTVSYTSSDPAVASVSGNELTIHGAGTVEITASQAGDDTYNAAMPVVQSLVINPKAITVTAEDKTKVYGEDDPELTYTSSPELVAGDNFSGEPERAPGEDIGTYPIAQGTLALDSNYELTFESAQLTITPATITGITFADGSFVYDGVGKSLSVTGDLPSGTLVNYANNIRTDVGTQEVTATITGANYETLVLTADLTITPAAITGITFNDGSFVYDGVGKSLSVTGDLPSGTMVNYTDNIRTDVGTQEVTATITGANYETLVLTADLTITPNVITGITFNNGSFVYDGTARSLSIEGMLPEGTSVSYTGNSRTEVGTQEVTATVTGANYETLVLTADLTITPAAITGITFNDGSFVYDGTARLLSIEGMLPESTSVSYTGNSRTEVGTQEVTATITGANYETLVLIADLTITPNVITGITFNDGSFVYDGTARSLSIEGMLPEGTSVSYTGNSRTEVGTQEVTATITGANYETLELTADLEITPLAITVTADDKEKVYGATDPELTYTYTPELVTGDSFSGTLVREAGEEAGTYSIHLGTLALNANYILTFESATLEIVKAPVNNITFNDEVFVYDGTLHQLAITGTLPEGTSASYENNGRTDAGMQEVTATVTGENYETLVLTAVLTVEKAPQLIDFAPIADKDLENDPDFQLEATASSGLPVRYTYTYLSADPPAVISPDGMVSLLSSGEVEITAHQEGSANYLPANAVTRTLRINSSNASVSLLEINGTAYDNPGEETHYIMDCDNFASQAEVHIYTDDPNATVNPGRTFVIDTPEAGLYSREVTVTSQNGEQTRTYLVTVERRFNFDDIVEQKFNNVLLVNNNPETNGGYRFVKYEWFKNGALIGTGQYYSAGDNSNDLLDPTAHYSVRMTTDSGDVLTTCEAEIILEASLEMKAYPNPVLSGQLLHIMADLPQEELSQLSIRVYNQSGKTVLQTTGKSKETALSLPRLPGVYLVQCQTGQRQKTFKIIVK